MPTSTQPQTSWLEEFYASVDAMDITFVDRLCTPGTVVRFANHEPVVGRTAVKAALTGFWSTIGGMRHTFVSVLHHGDLAVLEAVVEYQLHGGGLVEIPIATVIERDGDLVAAQRVYADLAPLHTGG